jgi:4-amino-4-deoxy-L-arabinose transferase-like glycosyltransferase
MRRYYIYLILLGALALRLYQIDSPILGYHSWRQADTAAVARNFHEHGYNLFYPQIDWGGNSPGYVETEFQIYPFAVALLYKIFGVRELLGRLLSALLSLVSIYTLYLLVRKIIDERTALWTAIILAIVPLNVYYSRAFMPESALLMCSVVGVYLFSRWASSLGLTYLLLSAVFIALAGLIKIPTLYLGLPLIHLAWLRFGRRTLYQSPLWVYAILVFAPVGLWYYHAHRIFLESGLTFYIWGYGTDKWGNWHLLGDLKFYNRILFRSIAERHLTWPGFILFVIGLTIRRQGPQERLFDFWLISLAAYFAIVARGNYIHEYYQLPFVIPAAVFAGKTLAKYLSYRTFRDAGIRTRLVCGLILICALAVPMLSGLRYHKYMQAEHVSSPTYKLAKELERSTPADALVITVGNLDPTVLYLSHRRGWYMPMERFDQKTIEGRKRQGADYLAGLMHHFTESATTAKLQGVLDTHRVIASTDTYFIIQL